ncbi:MAG: DNA polymerase III subunit delta [Oscillospiraceae bacterium]
MAGNKKEKSASTNLPELRQALKSGGLQSLYIFTGEEAYLREYYLGELKKTLVPCFEEFNFHRCEGKGLTVRTLAEMAEAMPMMAERTLIVVTDFDPFQLGETEREQFLALISDFPEHCCMVLHYDLQEYKPNKVMKKLCKAMEERFTVVQFRAQERGELVGWVRRRCKALGKDIGSQAAEHLLFTCGSLMTGLIPEIAKVCAYAKGSEVTVKDIDAVASPVLEAAVFRLTDAISAGKYEQAAEELGKLFQQQEEPIALLSAIGRELRRLYSARLAIDGGKDRAWLMELWNMRSDYPARLLMDAARRVSTDWCREGVRMAQALDRRLKSEKGIDGEAELKLFLLRLEQGARR